MKVLFADTVHDVLANRLTEAGISCVMGHEMSIKEIFQSVHNYQGMVVRSRFPVDKSFLSLASNLKFIARSGSGLENIDLITAKELGIHVFSAPEGNRMAVAEHVIGQLLSLFNHLQRCDQEVRSGIWRREANRGIEISGRTVGIIGFGNNGSALAQVLQGYECDVLAYDKYKQDFAEYGALEVSLDELKNKCDVISLHLPQNEETKFMINDEFINTCARPFYLVNSSRGKIVQTSALVNGLKSGQVIGACLDVFEYEKASFESLTANDMPVDFKYLLESKNVVLSPHVAGWTTESYFKLSSILADKILKEFP